MSNGDKTASCMCYGGCRFFSIFLGHTNGTEMPNMRWGSFWERQEHTYVEYW